MQFRQGLLATSALLAAFVGGSVQAQAQTTDTGSTIGELVVTAQRREEALQDVPIAVSAFDQGSLERSKIDAGPNLVTVVPNVNFGKANFTGSYNFQIRGIGSKAVGASADPGTGIHLNNAPLITNNLFDAEFYDLQRLEVLRGPQGTLYGRNATGGVVNILTAKPSDTFEGNIRAEYGSYNEMKLRGMVNLPLGDSFALRLAGNYLKRDGYGENLVTGNDADDRDLYGLRGTLSFEPTERFRSWLMWDHFSENDSRSRIGKQFCAKDLGPTTIGGVAFSPVPIIAQVQRGFFTQGCRESSLYDPASLGTVNSQGTLGGLFGTLGGFQTGDAYAGKFQTSDPRDIESAFDPIYKSKTNIWQFNAEFDVTESVTASLTSSYTDYRIYTRQDYNRYTPSTTFNAAPNPVNALAAVPGYAALYASVFPAGVINDPQNGPSNQFATSDISTNDAQQWSHEVRFQSNFDGPVNFNLGGLLTKYNSATDYFVMFNTGTGWYQINNRIATGNANCIGAAPCVSIDPNKDPTRIGHNYFDNYQPYELTSHAIFGELYWQVTETLKLTLGGRYSVDSKETQTFLTNLGVPGQGVIPAGTRKAKFKEPTGRFGFDWKPELGFTDETLIYGFYSRGYKPGGINPAFSPGIGVVPAPATFDPEFIDAFEIGTKNTVLNGAMTLNVTAFHYDYKGYQVSKIINRTSINENIDARVQGLEFESVWSPVDGLRLNAAIGYLDTKLKNVSSIDIFNRTAGNASLIVVKSNTASNCVVTLANAQLALTVSNSATGTPFTPLGICTLASDAGAGTNIGGSGAIAGGTNAFGGLVSEGVAQDLSGNDLPNSPHWTVALGAQYTMAFGDWEATLRGDYYRQSKTYARIYNSVADRIKAWDNVNLTLTVDNRDMGVQLGAFVKNATNETAITDTYLTDDSSGLFRNVFYTEPRLYGVFIQKSF